MTSLPNRLQTRVDAAIAKGVVGCAVAHRKGDAPASFAVAGLANLETKTPLAVDAQFRIASITKTFVCAVLLQLYEEGKVSLDTTIDRWLPGKPFADQATVDDILMQTGGLPVYSLYRLEDYPPTGSHLPDTIFIDHAYKRTPPRAPDRSRYEYANVGSRVIGKIIQDLTGTPLAIQIQNRLLKPLGLADTLPSGWKGAPPPRLARGYYIDSDAPMIEVTHRVPPSYIWSGGDMYSTVADLATWVRALCTGKVLSSALTETVRTRLIPGPLAGSTMSHHGLGIMAFTQNSRRVLGYRGSTPGFVGIAAYDPIADVAVAVQANSFSPDAESIHRSEVEHVLFDAFDLA
ncbi:MAG: class A beta-lactamase-related serine hydrolase [Rhodospirillales bacterium]|nr:class A beta-lactamase-related serine hydrolase [Rhodospirillales bacterium]